MNTRRWVLGGALGLSLLGMASIGAMSGAGMRGDTMGGHAGMGSRHFGGGLIYQLNEARRWLER